MFVQARWAFETLTTCISQLVSYSLVREKSDKNVFSVHLKAKKYDLRREPFLTALRYPKVREVNRWFNLLFTWNLENY